MRRKRRSVRWIAAAAAALALVPVLDEFGDTAGVRMITDREKLLRFLRIASEAEYRCLFLDVRFERGLESEQDSALYDLMRRLPRFAFSTHHPVGGIRPVRV